MLSRWIRWLVVAPVVLFVFGAMFVSCGGSSGGGPTSTPTAGFSLQAITIANGAAPTPSFTPTATGTATASPSGSPKPTKKPTPTKTPKTTPTLTPRPAATSTTIAPGSVPTGGTVAFNAIGTLTKKSKTKFVDITTGPFTLWTSSDNTVFQAPPSGSEGGMYTTGFAGCACILASSSGVSSQFVGVGVYVDVGTCPLCGPPVPTPTATATSAAAVRGALEPASSSTPAPSSRNAGVLMWSFDPGAELRGKIATGADGSIYFITRDGVLHGLNSAGKEVMRRDAAGSSPAVLPDGTVIAMSSASALAAIGRDGVTLWSLEIGDSAGPLATTDRAIYASTGADLVSVSTTGAFNWRVNVGPATSAALTQDGIVVGTSRGAVTALASDGAVLWTFQPDGGFSGSVADADDVVYAGSANGGVYAIDLRTGNPVWHLSSGHTISAGPVIAPSGAIFAGSDTIVGVSADGQLRWKNSSLAPGETGLIVLGYDGVFDAAIRDVAAVLTGDGTTVWTSRSFGKITTAASSPSGMLYVGTSTGRIFAVR
jgi:outer membrane protein assembly factor BamB